MDRSFGIPEEYKTMDVRRLELLLALSRQGLDARGLGDLSGVTTSTVSQQIAALAKEVGTPLLEPDGRRVRLTPAGQRLAGHAVTHPRRPTRQPAPISTPSADRPGRSGLPPFSHRNSETACCPS